MDEQHKSLKVKLSEITKNALTHIFIINNHSRAVTISSMVSTTNDVIRTYQASMYRNNSYFGVIVIENEKTVILLSSVDLIVQAYETMILRLSIRNCGKASSIKL